MPKEDYSAKVFISCGQRKGTYEEEVAKELENMLEEMEFDPYLAIETRSLRGLKENIFRHLKKSEYFLFIDFKREQLAGSSEHRGSLYSHQELAVASYLGLDVLAFQQEGVKELDGMIRNLQANAITFSDPYELPQRVKEQIIKEDWDTERKNILTINRDPNEYEEALLDKEKEMIGRFFHLNVKNLNPRETALHCTAYVESIKSLDENKNVPLRQTELVWAGTKKLPQVPIIRDSSRLLDGFLVLHNEPNKLIFNCFSSSTSFMKPIKGPGDLEITYNVISDNFPPASEKFKIHIGESLEDWSFKNI